MLDCELLIKDVFSVYVILDNRGHSDVLEFLDAERAENEEDRNERVTLTRRLVKMARAPRSLGDCCYQIEPTESLFQIKTEFHRVLWFYDSGRVILITHIFEKDENGPAPRAEVEKAIRIKNMYINNKNKDTINWRN
jgi:hypothetical protein